jgi:hypothetical protein
MRGWMCVRTLLGVRYDELAQRQYISAAASTSRSAQAASAAVARMADAAAVEACFASLPLALLLVIFALLPVDQRMRCAEVCRGWRDALLERSLWTQLDLSEASGGLARPTTKRLLRAAAARAGGQLHTLNVAVCPGITQKALLAVVTANAGALRELRAWHVDSALSGFANIASLLRAAPQLRVFDADVACDSVADAQRLLRNEGAWAPLRLRKLQVRFDVQTEAAVLSLAADAAAHASLVQVLLIAAPLNTPAALDAVVAAALANRFSTVALGACRLGPASTPALARLLGGGALRSLLIGLGNAQLLNAAAAVVFGDALRANRTLKSLMLSHAALWRDPAVAVTLLGAVTAHGSLSHVILAHNPVGDAQNAAGAALGALVAADAPSLEYLDLPACGLQEAALRPLVDALPANTHLRTLLLGKVTASAAFLRDRLLPAVRSNASLTSLEITVTGEGDDAAREAQEIVNSRAAR